MTNLEKVKGNFEESIKVKERILKDENFLNTIYEVAKLMALAIKNGGKLILCGNGGSASDSLHFAGEIVGRFQKERSPWPAIVLNADVTTLTAISNDYGYDYSFSRQVSAFAKPEDVFVGISTSGNSTNIINAVYAAKEKNCKSVILAGNDGGKLKDLADYCLIAPSNVTARIQESHICIIHTLCGLIEDFLDE